MPLDHVAHLRSESELFRTALAGADPAARVPTCPDWSAADLLWHLAEVQLFWVEIVTGRLQEPDPAEAAAPPRPARLDDLLVLSNRATAALAAALEAAADDVAVWTWAVPQTVGFVRQWQAHEALMHRVDAELAAGSPVTGINPELAAEGIRMVVEHAFSWAPDWPEFRPLGGAGMIEPSDAPGCLVQAWGFSGTSPNTGKVYADEPLLRLADSGPPSFTARGTASELDRWLWSRGPEGSVAFDGDAEDLARFRRVVAKGVQ